MSSDYHYFVDKPTNPAAPLWDVVCVSRFWTRQGDPDYDTNVVSSHATEAEAGALVAELNAREAAADQERREKFMARAFRRLDPTEPDAATLEHEIETQAFLSRNQL